MSFENIIFEIQDNIAIIRFNRPKALNALNQAVLDEFNTAITSIEENSDVRVLVLTGSGEKAFIAGADIAEMSQMNPLQGKKFSRKGQKILARLEKLPIPVIAAVNGFALGGGTETSLACDFIYASEKAIFGLPEITLGIIPGFGGTQRLQRLVGPNMARELVFTGKTFSAAEAKEMGIVNRVCPPETLMEETMKTAKAIAKKGQASLRAAKEAIAVGRDSSLETGCIFEADAFAVCMTSIDAKEGTGAFVEKRKAEFKGSLES